MRYIPLAFEIDLREGFAFDVGSLFAHLTTLHDQRDARGLRYALVTVLVFVILAKLAGENHLRGIAEWVAYRKELLAEGLGLVKPQAPHPSTYSRILGHAIDIAEFEQLVNRFFATQPESKGWEGDARDGIWRNQPDGTGSGCGAAALVYPCALGHRERPALPARRDPG